MKMLLRIRECYHVSTMTTCGISPQELYFHVDPEDLRKAPSPIFLPINCLLKFSLFYFPVFSSTFVWWINNKKRNTHTHGLLSVSLDPSMRSAVGSAPKKRRKEKNVRQPVVPLMIHDYNKKLFFHQVF